jgi:hypothetical protein
MWTNTKKEGRFYKMYRAELENDNAVCCPFQGLSAIKRFKPLL